MPKITPSDDKAAYPFGTASATYTLSANLGYDHEAATGGMRDLDRLATGCLREAGRRKRKLVERDLLARVFDRDGLERSE